MNNTIIQGDDFGVVLIGRNEGERLKASLKSVSKYTDKLVYVDSDSTDGSCDMALAFGATVIELDMAVPFTAARARNEGFNKLFKLFPEISYVKFVDGDCEIVDGWLTNAVNFLKINDSVAAVFGRLRERFPDRSVYNKLCDIEWDTPPGETKACGGNAMIRVNAFKQVDGFEPGLIAGEEPELCVRLRRSGWKIWCLDTEMALHDAAITRFSQWWKRSVRTGYAFAAGAYMHGKLPEKHWISESRSAWVWGLLIPLVTISLVYSYGIWALTVLMLYPLQVVRLTLIGNQIFKVNLLRAIYLVLGKFPEVLGALKFLVNRISNTNSRIIEYK